MAPGLNLSRLPVRALLPFLVALSSLILLIFPTLVDIFNRWLKFDESYSHGLLLLAVSVWLIFRTIMRNTLLAGFYPLWLLPFVLALIAYGLGDILRLEALSQLTVVPLLLGLLAIFLGWSQVRLFIVPVGVLIFTIPFWDYLSWSLQLITVEINRLLLGLFDIDFEVQGVYVYLLGIGAFEVANGCSGLRYLLVGQSLALLYGELNFRRLKSRVIFFLTAVFFALLANWIRVFVIIYMGHETNMQSSLIDDHEAFGWWVFAGTLVPLFYIGYRMEIGQEAAEEAAALPFKGGRAAVARNPWYAGVAAAAFPLLVLFLLPSGSGEVRAQPDTLRIDLGGDRYAPLFDARLNGWRPQIRNPDFVYQQTLADKHAIGEQGGLQEQLFVGVYGYEYQRHRAELIQYVNRVYRKDQWIAKEFFRVPSPVGDSLQGMTLRSSTSEAEIHLAYTYYVGSLWETDELRAKLLQIVNLLGPRTDASLIVFGVSCDDCDGEAALESMVGDLMPVVVEQVDSLFVE
ncbi:exosortase [Marinobacter flavimaris]|uniref:exosortase n=1 Tax=Marinobacter flavimaris TaxID=262076 RepID=UPI00386826D0